MRTPLLLVLTSALVLGAACRKAPTAPPANQPAAPAPADPAPAPAAAMSDAELDALMRDAMKFFGAIADAVTAARADCAKMAAGIEKVTSEHEPLLKRARTLDEDPAAQDRADAWMQAHSAEIKPTFDRMKTGLERCQQDPAVQAALEKMSGPK